jgi:hypothetical protein
MIQNQSVMKTFILLSVITAVFLLFPKMNHGQIPDFGNASGFAVFSSAGAFTNVGPSIVTGDAGNNAGAFTAFPPGTLYGQIHNLDAVSAQAAASLASANDALIAMVCGTTIAPAMGNGQVITPGVYCQTAVSTLTGDLILDAQGDPNAIFIIKLGGTFTTAASSNIILANAASLCNVCWHVVGAVVLGANSTFGGTIVSNAAVTVNDGVVLSGRAFTTAGAIALTNTTITIAAMPQASVILAGGPTSFCSGGSVVLSGNINGVWSNADTTATLTANTSGDYFVTNSNIYCSATSNHINITVNPLPLATTGNDVSICNGNHVSLGTADISGHTYAWSPASGLSSSTIANPVANPSVTTTYTLTETITATACVNSNALTVTVDNVLSPAVISANGPTIFCENESVVLSGNNGGTWSNTVSITTPSLTVNTSGDYFVTDTNSCNTVMSNHIMVTVNPQPEAITGSNSAICYGSSVALGTAAIPGHSYSWTPASGLSSSTIANPTANPTVTTIYSLTETINATVCSKTNSVTIVVNPIPLATTGSDAAICDSIILGAEPIAGHSYLWTPATGLNSATLSNPVASPPATITYILTETITSSGCSGSNSVTITVNPLPLAVTGNNTAICNGFNLTLGTAALSGHTYSWIPATGLNSATISNPVANPSATTTYTLTETITLTGCQKSNAVIITVNPSPLAYTGNDAAICSGNSITLGTAPITGHTYSWTPTAGLVSALTSDPLASPSATTTFTLTESITATGCQSNNTVTITVNPLPAAFTGPNADICFGNDVTLGSIAIPGNTYLWSPSTGLSLATISNPVASPASTVTYQLKETTTLTGCFLINYVDITVHPLPLAITGSNTAICAGNSVTLGAPAIPGHSYAWSPSNGLSSATSAQPYASPLSTTSYTLTEIITATNCQNANFVTITVNPLPSASTVGIASICSGDSVAIGGSSTPGNTYLWSPVTDLNSPTISNPMASPAITTIYNVTETVISSGCSNSNPVTVMVNPAPYIITQPADQAVLSGSPAVFTVEVSGTNLSYQWRKGLTDLINGGNISGAHTDTLNIIAVSPADTSNSYNVVISGMCFMNTASQNASLSIAIISDIFATDVSNTSETVSVYPNPFAGPLHIVVTDPAQTGLEFTVYNVIGEKILFRILNIQRNTIETGTLKPGMYFYNVIRENQILQSGKLICN